MGMPFQFTHSGRGATYRQGSPCTRRCRFNSRTLGRVRLLISMLFPPTPRVSIHAPWEGCDHARTHRSCLWGCFNSRTLGRVRPLTGAKRFPTEGFNSRTLGRVRLSWRRLVRLLCVGFNSRTLGRVRQCIMTSIVARIMFQFTHPGKGATPSWEASLVILDSFNSRTLGRVRRRRAVRGSLSGQVSIHAPWEGCDTKGTEPNIYRDGFNSRTLGRVRHGGIDAGYVMDSFNSRTLGRVRLFFNLSEWIC